MSISSLRTGAIGISAALDNNYMEPIASTLVGAGGVNTIIFNDIPQGYKHLQVRITAQSNRATYSFDDLKLAFNSSATDLTRTHSLYGEGANAESGAYTTNTVGQRSLGTNIVGNFGAYVIDILDYTNTSKNKVFRALAGTDSNGVVAGFAPMINLASGLYLSTSAISSMAFTPTFGTLFNQHSRFSLYGIKG
jgi:hypothetical protein